MPNPRKESNPAWVGVIPTDTIYGIVGPALDRVAVARIYRLRERNRKKPMIILIGDIHDLEKFGIRIDTNTKKLLKKYWPGKVSIILPCASKKFSYLHRGTKTLAFRLPRPAWLRNFLKQSGPLVAPSANIEGERPARTLREAQNYFGADVDFYLDGGKLVSKPSTIIEIKSGRVLVVRK